MVFRVRNQSHSNRPASGIAIVRLRGAPLETVVRGRMVCSQKCRRMLDLANGIHRCKGCPGICNVAHRYCTKCANRLGVCEVCGRKMAPAAAAGKSAGG